MNRIRFPLRFLAAFGLGCCLLHCASYPAQNPIGRAFPLVKGRSLSGQPMVIPNDLQGAPALIIIGYKQRSQFDIDRWLLGLSTKTLTIPVYEVPSVVGFIPGLISDRIDRGMRSGIPEEDWSQVVTLYDDAEKVAEFTGNENGIVGRVILLNAQGKVHFFHDRGFSVGSLERLMKAIEELSGQHTENSKKTAEDAPGAPREERPASAQDETP